MECAGGHVECAGVHVECAGGHVECAYVLHRQGRTQDFGKGGHI